MQNRRRHYRHDFPPTRPVSVKLQSQDGSRTIEGDLIDLSIGGMCVYASALKNDTTENWSAIFQFETDANPFKVAAKRIRRHGNDPARCGFHFLAEDDPEKSDEQEKRIWRFLLAEQRRRRKHLA
jgi:c-di-GMP-binding flagellar brake protein YcgR